jgi:hypothetical protein
MKISLGSGRYFEARDSTCSRINRRAVAVGQLFQEPDPLAAIRIEGHPTSRGWFPITRLPFPTRSEGRKYARIVRRVTVGNVSRD